MARNNIQYTFANWLVNPYGFYDSAGNQTSWEATYYYTYPKEITKKVDDFWSKFWVEQSKPMVSDNAKLPRTNAYEDGKGITLECFVPFASRDDVNITLDPVMNSIRIEVEAHQGEDENVEYHLKEISRTSMKRTFILDKRFDISKAEGSFEGSVLKIVVPYGKDSEKKTLTLK